MPLVLFALRFVVLPLTIRVTRNESVIRQQRKQDSFHLQM